ncbi:MAG: HD domain-containing protein [Planctomycetota bacterium]|nr:HD domain-containing protein [Planctomycetota bacterium]
MIDPEILEVSRKISRAGGRALLVGGSVRDPLLGIESKDHDLEVYGLPLAKLEEVLSGLGEVIRVGRAFGVLRVKGLDVDFSLPRRDSKTGRGHRGFQVELDPQLTFADAARRRDLTINSMGLDPLTGELLDPHGGKADLERGVLRATDPAHFAEDPLRGLRVAQFAARFAMDADEELERLSAALDLEELPGERLFEEFRKLLLKGRRPSLGLEFLRRTELLRFFPELEAMVGVPQDPHWHPEGTVWEHTLLVVDEAAAARIDEEGEDLAVMFGALCHDLGKPAVTLEEDGRIRSPRHEEEGVAPTESFLGRLRAPNDLVRQVVALVRHHLAPAHFQASGSTPKAFRRLTRKLQQAGVSARTLHRVAMADHFGRTTPDALERRFPSGDEFLRRM